MSSVIARSETVSMVKPASFITVSVAKSDVGIAIRTTIALRQERRNRSITMPVKTTASPRVMNTPLSCCCV